jgi:predicted hotdog family 3-hydroxylacyl-ACP dehydratase
MRLDHDWIAAHIPHQGRMCLLDEVRSWNQDSIECVSATHRAPDHPLRAHGRLGSACLLEYAAQAMAVHGALLQGPSARAATAGLLVSARALELWVADLDGIEGELLIRAERQHADDSGALYGFRVSEGDRLLAQGRAGVRFDASTPATSGSPP